MKELKLYQCDICGKQFDDKTKAEDCERNHGKHRKVINTISAKYRSFLSDENSIPDSIIVEFNDGSKTKYKIDELAVTENNVK